MQVRAFKLNRAFLVDSWGINQISIIAADNWKKWNKNQRIGKDVCYLIGKLWPNQ